MSKYKDINTIVDFDWIYFYKNSKGWYSCDPDEKYYHFGEGFHVELVRNALTYYQNYSEISREELKSQLKIMKTPLYKVIYGN